MNERQMTVDQYREVQEHLSKAWNKMFSYHADRDMVEQAGSMLRKLRSQGAADWGTPQVEGCEECAINSVFGGPRHNPSSHCRSGKRPHCTCDACF